LGGAPVGWAQLVREFHIKIDAVALPVLRVGNKLEKTPT